MDGKARFLRLVGTLSCVGGLFVTSALNFMSYGSQRAVDSVFVFSFVLLPLAVLLISRSSNSRRFRLWSAIFGLAAIVGVGFVALSLAGEGEPQSGIEWIGRIFGVYVIALIFAPAIAVGILKARGDVEPGTCARCGYCLFGISEGRCPECGESFRAAPKA